MSSAPNPVSWSWPAEVSSVSTARHTVMEWLRGHALPDPPLSDIALVVSEAVTNAVTHAYVGLPPGEIHVRVNVDPGEVMVMIQDDGLGLRPRVDSPGLGFGLALMVMLSERFEAQTVESRGTRLCAWFSRDPAAATLLD